MPKRERELLGVFVGDLHCGSPTAPAPRGKIESTAGEWVSETFQTFVAETLALVATRRTVIFLGGDLVDGSRHHGTYESWGTPKEQRDAAIGLLLPLTSKAAAVYGLIGTEAHAGPKGDDDRTVAEELGAKSAEHTWHLTLGGQRLDWAHHGVSVPRDPTNEDSGMLAEARRQYQGWLKRLAFKAEFPDTPDVMPKPDLVVRHHAHFSPRPVNRLGITVAVCPCWQLSNSFGYKIGPERVPSIGALYWHPERGAVERKLYPVERSYAEVKV